MFDMWGNIEKVSYLVWGLSLEIHKNWILFDEDDWKNGEFLSGIKESSRWLSERFVLLCKDWFKIDIINEWLKYVKNQYLVDIL